MEALRDLVIKGPDPERHKVTRWRCFDLREEIATRWSVTVCEQTVGRWLRQLRMIRVQPRPYHPKRTLNSRRLLKKLRQPGKRGASRLGGGQDHRDLWFQDEARVRQQRSLEYIWAPIGSRPRAVHDNRRDSVYLFGALCAYRAAGAAVIMPAVNSETMSELLKEISTQVVSGAHAVLVCDGAGWNQRGDRLEFPDNITLLPLPPYSPELNPMENVWDYLRGNKLSHRV